MVALAGVQPALSRSMQRLETALQVSLWDGVYQLIILPHPVEEAGITCAKYGEEHLFFSLPPAHPLSGSKALYMKALNGETMLLRNRLGFWREMAVRKMPDTRFLEQEDVAFNELVQFSALPSFTTDVALRREGSPKNRINIPILDEEANVTYYYLCRPPTCAASSAGSAGIQMHPRMGSDSETKKGRRWEMLPCAHPFASINFIRPCLVRCLACKEKLPVLKFRHFGGMPSKCENSRPSLGAHFENR